MADRVIGGRYRIIGDLIGFGGFGRVWKAHDERLGVDVAIKEIIVPASATPQEHAERVARAEREARNAAKLREHPNIVAVHDVVRENDLPMLVMDFVAGESLADRLRRDGPLPVDEAAKVASAMLDALAHAHAEDVVHRDVKPANIMLASDGRALLTDFGIAVHATDTTMTGTGGFIGSVEYMAPERFDGVTRPTTDLYSLGVTLYEAVEGRSPFHRDTPTGTFAAVIRGDAAEPTRAGHLTGLITALMSVDAKDRPDIAAARTLLAEPVTEHVRTPPPGDTRKIEAKPSTSPAAALFLIVVAVIAAIIYFANQKDDTAAASDTTTTEYTPPTTEAYTETETYTDTETETYEDTDTETADTTDPGDPCDVPDSDTLDEFGLGAPKPQSDDSSTSCYWYVADDGVSRSYGILSLHYLMGDPDVPVEGDPISLPGVDAAKQDDGDTCTIVWSTSFGKAVVIGSADDYSATPSLCDAVELWADYLFASVPG